MTANRWLILLAIVLLGTAVSLILYRQSRPDTLTSDRLTSGDRFGQMIAVDGDQMAVGAWGDSDNGSDAGAVHLFVWQDGDWVQTDKLYARDAGPFQLFGASIALNDGWLAATSCAGRGIYEAGQVHLFQQNGRFYNEIETLPFTNCTNQSNLLAMTDEMLVVGVPGDREARVYRLENGRFTQTAALKPLETRLYSITDQFSRLRAVAAQNGRIVITLENGAGVFVFEQIENEWIETQKLTPLDTSPSYGAAIALEGDTVLVGDPTAAVCRSGTCSAAGTVYVFQFDNNQWAQTAKLEATDPIGESWFGGALLLVGDTAVIGAPTEIAGSFGAAYRFTNCNGEWQQEQRLVAGAFPRTETAIARGLAETQQSLRSRSFSTDELIATVRGGFDFPVMIATGPALALHNNELLIGPTRGVLNGRSAIYRFPHQRC